SDGDGPRGQARQRDRRRPDRHRRLRGGGALRLLRGRAGAGRRLGARLRLPGPGRARLGRDRGRARLATPEGRRGARSCAKAAGMKIELVVFDMAGTTVHDGDAVHRALMATLSAHGKEVTRDEVNAVMGLPKPEAIRWLLAGEASPAQVASLHADFLGRMVGY